MNLWVCLRDVLVADTEAGCDPGAEVLDENIACLQQPVRLPYVVGALEIEDDGALVEVVRRVGCREAVLLGEHRLHELAFGAFDLDDVRAHARE